MYFPEVHKEGRPLYLILHLQSLKLLILHPHHLSMCILAPLLIYHHLGIFIKGEGIRRKLLHLLLLIHMVHPRV
ncbi:hypothetical protein RchiOBHm_Chr3g0452821 [Rosa chinensis]|uniref:Uncharacterized protein n=1 Tax=Rosa chinensis TaxID=74649 RepID=A0A2P6R6D5_ROSCH|nr:hypothetical protein RchiOBHm_Chr3g0452821 [Rosa chinensis]